MAGHSKWAQIKRAKGANDAKRGQLFSKLAKEITISAKLGASEDPDLNPRLRMVLMKCKQANMPNDIVTRALKKASEASTGNIEELSYEVFGPGGVAIYCEVQTDNRNRTAAEIRYILTRKNGQLATSGAVSRLFERKGQFLINQESVEEETLMELVLEAGAEDFKSEEGIFEVITEPSQFESVLSAIESKEIPTEIAHITFIPTMMSEVSEEVGASVQNLVDALEENEDVKEVFSNAHVSEA